MARNPVVTISRRAAPACEERRTDEPSLTVKRLIRDIPDFPKPGIVFKDITPLLADADGVPRHGRRARRRRYRGRVDTVLGIESRGFIIGAAAALALGTGFAIVRKPGKLPFQTHRASYELEYGTDTLEIHHDAIGHGHRVLLVDDLLATGGTASAAVELVRALRRDRHRVRVRDRARRS